MSLNILVELFLTGLSKKIITMSTLDGEYNLIENRLIVFVETIEKMSEK